MAVIDDSDALQRTLVLGRLLTAQYQGVSVGDISYDFKRHIGALQITLALGFTREYRTVNFRPKKKPKVLFTHKYDFDLPPEQAALKYLERCILSTMSGSTNSIPDPSSGDSNDSQYDGKSEYNPGLPPWNGK